MIFILWVLTLVNACLNVTGKLLYCITYPARSLFKKRTEYLPVKKKKKPISKKKQEELYLNSLMRGKPIKLDSEEEELK